MHLQLVRCVGGGAGVRRTHGCMLLGGVYGVLGVCDGMRNGGLHATIKMLHTTYSDSACY